MNGLLKMLNLTYYEELHFVVVALELLMLKIMEKHLNVYALVIKGMGENFVPMCI